MMTKQEIMAMKPGPEMDALVAEKVMGWKWVRTPSVGENVYYLYPSLLASKMSPDFVFTKETLPASAERHYIRTMPQYSRSISDAWMVVEKITEPPTSKEEAERESNAKFAYWFERVGLWAYTSSEAAEEICKAALISVVIA